MELFYGPIISALSVSTLFLVSRTFSFSIKTSLLLSFLFAFSTELWAYSQTSLNSLPSTFFMLLGFLFFRQFQITSSHYKLVLSGIILGIGFLTRQDVILFIIPLFFFMIYELRNKNGKILIVNLENKNNWQAANSLFQPILRQLYFRLQAQFL